MSKKVTALFLVLLLVLNCCTFAHFYQYEKTQKEDLKTTNEALNTANGQIISLQTELAATNTALADANTALDMANGQITALQTELTATDTALADTNIALDTANGQITALQTELAATNTALADTNTALDTANGEITALQAELTSTKTELAATNTALADTNTALDTANGQITALQTELTATNTALSETNAALDTANSQITALQTEMAATNTALTETNTALETANGEINALKTDMAAMKTELAAKNTALQTDLTAGNGQVYISGDATKVGTYITFGVYEQDGDESNGKEPIEWLVLDYDSNTNQALLISRYALDARAYNTEWVDITWEKCTLRSWLNNEFINAAFTAEEQMAIPTVTVKAEKNPKYDTDPGRDTQDRVFLLSISEVNKYFKSDDARMCAPTDYAISQGTARSTDYGYDYAVDGRATCWWWLRSPGYGSNYAAGVRGDGSVNTYGGNVGYGNDAVRPTLHMDLNLIP